MKIRTDFVSNSSSSSFILKDIKKSIKLLNDLGTMPYDIESNLSFTISYYHKDAKEICENLLCEKYDDRNMYDWCGKRIQPNEIEYSWRVDLFRLIDALENNSDILDKLLEVSIVTEENNNLAITVLYMLYKYFKLKGVEPDASCTEISFLDDDSRMGNFMIKLFTEIENSERKA